MDSMRYPLTRKAAMDRESNGVRVGTVVALGLLGAVVGAASRPHLDVAAQVSVKLSEWNVGLSQASIAAGPVTFVVTKDRKSTRLNSSHVESSYAVFCLKKIKMYRILILCQ